MGRNNDLDNILTKYQASFKGKIHTTTVSPSDILMETFGITDLIKDGNKQYWGRELGKCWEGLVIEACKNLSNYQPALRIGSDEPCDLIIGEYAIDTKYRVGSGDSGTLKKFKEYGVLLKSKGYIPVFLFLREDNLNAAMTACKSGGWEIYTGDDSFEFIKNMSGFDIKNYLISNANKFKF
jgi:hypothetical protein